MAIFDLFKKKPAQEEALSRKEKQTVLRVIRRQESIVRRDIIDWRTARLEATLADEPKQHRLQVLYNEVMLDAKMTSQISLRIGKSQSADWCLKKGDQNDEESMRVLTDKGLFDKLVKFIVESHFYSQSLVQFTFDKVGDPDLELVPRTNVSPATGRFYPDVYGGESEQYRDRPDFGKWVLEFCPDRSDLGILNKAVPYVLMKKFALSCWSELCEIYGIPPRVLKTNTQDTDMLNRAEAMMREIGAAAYFIIDTEEEFEFAQASNTNGDVYKNFIATCDEQISLLNLGAVLGQDTEHGNRSKEEASTDLMEIVVEADKRKIAYYINKTAIPAMESLGIIPAGLRFEFAKATDTEKLWDMVYQASAYYEFDVEWLKQTFGMEITRPRMNPNGSDDGTGALKAGSFNFFG
ncbi:MAG: DUF935 family protein [Bacteroidales bacterium]|nr:DUF935 family protein [Bacteroidales bacterium]